MINIVNVIVLTRDVALFWTDQVLIWLQKVRGKNSSRSRGRYFGNFTVATVENRMCSKIGHYLVSKQAIAYIIQSSMQ